MMSPFGDLLYKAQGESVRAVSQTTQHGMLTGLHFVLSSGVLSVRAIADEDTLDVSFATHLPEKATECADPICGSLIGNVWGWSWTAFNQQGYLDTLMIGAGEVKPAIVITVVASELKIGSVDWFKF